MEYKKTRILNMEDKKTRKQDECFVCGGQCNFRQQD